jgi:hypothetical protein
MDIKGIYGPATARNLAALVEDNVFRSPGLADAGRQAYSGRQQRASDVRNFEIASICGLLEQRYTRVHRDSSSHDDHDVSDFQCHDSLPLKPLCLSANGARFRKFSGLLSCSEQFLSKLRGAVSKFACRHFAMQRLFCWQTFAKLSCSTPKTKV